MRKNLSRGKIPEHLRAQYERVLGWAPPVESGGYPSGKPPGKITAGGGQNRVPPPRWQAEAQAEAMTPRTVGRLTKPGWWKLPKVSREVNLRGGLDRTPRRWPNGLLQGGNRRLKPATIATIIALVIILLLGPAVYLLSLSPKSAEAAWWNDHWMYRKKIEISYSGSSTLTEYQVLIDGLDTASLISAGKTRPVGSFSFPTGVQSDCDDIRITDINGKVLALWIEKNNLNLN